MTDDEPQLQTFVFADLAGYTALTEAHGDERAADAAAEFCDSVRPLLDRHDAEEVKAIGDALMLRVPEARSAARLATQIICGYGARHQSLGIRIGMHTGTAVQRGGDWFGAAVNLASRVADVAQAGEVLLTDATRDALGGSVRLRRHGERAFKNVADPVGLHALALGEPAAPGAMPVDPVCRMAIDPALAAGHEVVLGVAYHFCSEQCRMRFLARPDRYARH